MSSLKIRVYQTWIKLMDENVSAAISRVQHGACADECETSTLGFQEDRGSRDDLVRSIVKAALCFTNAAGGTIIVGVADKVAGQDAFRATDLQSGWLQQRIYELTQPRLLVEIRELSDPVRLLAIRVHQSATVHADTQGRSWHRVNRECLPLSPQEQARLVEERHGYDWSAEVSERPLADALPVALEAARSLLRNLTDERGRLGALGDEDLLSALGVSLERRWLTRAGELLFCARVQTAPDAMLYQYRQTPGGEPRAVQRPPFPLITAYLRVRDLISARQQTTPITLPSGQQIAIEDFPDAAIREALSNAVCHRDWRSPGLVTVDHAPEVLTVMSPGPLVPGVTPENILTTNSRPRNPLLARVVRILGLAEETGRGIDRMYREAIRAGKDVPAIEGGLDYVRVSFRGGAPDTNIARFVAQLPSEEQEDTDTMLLLFHLCRSRTISAIQASPLLQKPAEEASLVLRRLAASHVALIEPTRESAARKRPVYRLRGDALKALGTAVTYNRRTIDEIDRKVVAHVGEYGKITNRTLQNYFDVQVFKARDILADLAQRGVLTRISAQARGPKVEWGPGPNFPGPRSRKDVQREASVRPEPELIQQELPLAAPTRRERRKPDPKQSL